MTDERQRLHALVQGRVQGVGFRQFTVRQALALGVAGWVRNLPDGRVEVTAEGPRPALETLLDRLRAGPRLARVDAVQHDWQHPGGECAGFDVR